MDKELRKTENVILHKVIPNQVKDVQLLFSKQGCSGTTVKNNKETLMETKQFFHKTAIIWFIIAAPIMLLGIIGLILTMGYTYILMLPFFLIIITGALLINLAFKDDTTSKMLGKAVKDFHADKKYVVIYHTPRTLIHELLHIRKRHLETKGSNLRQDWEIMPDVWRTLREIRREA